jgi:ribonuclease P protein component
VPDRTSGSRRFRPFHRLTSAEQFSRVFSHPVKSSGYLITVLASTSEISEARLGVVVAKKKIRTAVARNRIKRLVRESFRQHRQQLSGLDIVVLPRMGCEKQTNQKIFRELEQHWQFLAKQGNA